MSTVKSVASIKLSQVKLIIRSVGPIHIIKTYTTLPMIFSVPSEYMRMNLFCSKFKSLMLQVAALKTN